MEQHPFKDIAKELAGIVDVLGKPGQTNDSPAGEQTKQQRRKKKKKRLRL
jgi:hypothetical protein